MRDDFNLIIDSIATKSILTSEIIRIQDTFSRNSIHYLTIVRDNIVRLLVDSLPGLKKESIDEVADYLSGLNAFRIKMRVAYIKKRLPHMSKWFVNAMATNHIVELYDIEQKLNTSFSHLYEELVDEKGAVKEFDNKQKDPEFGNEPTDYTVKADKAKLLLVMKEFHCKTNPTIKDTTKKYFEVDTIENLEEVLGGYADAAN